VYRAPRWGNIGMTMLQKAKIFVTDAGRVIMIISIVLWFLSSYGPSQKMDTLQKNYEAAVQANPSNTAVL
jgi:ferrous iron transport protein B